MRHLTARHPSDRAVTSGRPPGQDARRSPRCGARRDPRTARRSCRCASPCTARTPGSTRSKPDKSERPSPRSSASRVAGERSSPRWAAASPATRSWSRSGRTGWEARSARWTSCTCAPTGGARARLGALRGDRRRPLRFVHRHGAGGVARQRPGAAALRAAGVPAGRDVDAPPVGRSGGRHALASAVTGRRLQSRYFHVRAPSRRRTRIASSASGSSSRAFTPMRLAGLGRATSQCVTQPQRAHRTKRRRRPPQA